MSRAFPSGRTLVCGGAGYIGSHMCKLLSRQGFEVAVLDNFSTGHRAAVKWGVLYEGDVGDRDFLKRVFKDFSPTSVFHFAAKSITSESIADPALYYRNNVSASLALIEQVKLEKDCLLVFSSTASIFGEPRSNLVDEIHPTAPLNPYGWSKLIVERMLKDFWRAYGMSSVSFRYFNAAGADPSGEIGEWHEPETHLIPKLFSAALGGSALSIFGNDYDTPDGTCIRDYVHVNDLCTAHLLGLKYLNAYPGAHAFNLGNGLGFSVMQLVRAAETVSGRKIPFQIAARRPGDPARLVADSAAARTVLRWRPIDSEINRILGTAWDWHNRGGFASPVASHEVDRKYAGR